MSIRAPDAMGGPRERAVPVRARDDRGAGASGTGRAPSPDEDPALAEADRHWCCAGCGATITAKAAAFAQAGRHEHLCANPEGVRFRIGCFATAPGCVAFGRPTSRWSWFADYRWQVALCARCGAHLGWRFGDGGGHRFFGLILDRLVECNPRPEH